MKLLFTGIVLGILLGSCGSSLEDAKTISDYTGELNKKSLEEIHKSVSEDTAWLNSLIADAEDIHIVAGITFGVGQTDGKIEAALPFTLSGGDSSFSREFKNYASWSVFVPGDRGEKITDENFELKDDAPPVLKENKTKSRLEIVKVYKHGSVTGGDNSLAKVDSVSVMATADVPVAFDTLTFTKKDDQVMYHGKNVKGVSVDEKSVEFDLPVELYSKLLDIQALNESGVLMNKNSYSVFPAMSIGDTLLNGLRELQQMLQQVLLAKDKSSATDILKNISQKHIDIKNEVGVFIDYINSYKKISMSDIKKIEERGRNVLEISWQNIEAGFPDNVSKIFVYMATDFEHSELRFTAVNADSSAYDVYTLDSKEDNQKYGIADASGNVVIPARYHFINKKGYNYFAVAEKIKTI